MDNHYVLAKTQFYRVRYVGYICIDLLYTGIIYRQKYAIILLCFVLSSYITHWKAIFSWRKLCPHRWHRDFHNDNHRCQVCRQSWHHDNFRFSVYGINVIYYTPARKLRGRGILDSPCLSVCLSVNHIYLDDVIKWKHFPCYWPFVRGIHRSPVNSPQHKGQWR